MTFVSAAENPYSIVELIPQLTERTAHDTRQERSASDLLHKVSGQARCRIDGTDHLFDGTYHFWALAAEKKAEFAANWLLASELGSKSTPWPNPEQSLPIPALRLPNRCSLSSNMRIPICVGADGKQTDEVQCLYSARKPLREIDGLTPIKDFSADTRILPPVNGYSVSEERFFPIS
jgi:hypothetical protein